MRRLCSALTVSFLLAAAAPSALPGLHASAASDAYSPAAQSSGVNRSAESSSPSVTLSDLDGRPVNPFLAAENAPAIVFLFASVECPISNRYAPVVQRLHADYAAKGVAFWLVYPNPSDTPAAIREHLHAFNYPVHALRDPAHVLVKLARVQVTPETAVFERGGALAYHGRIDDRYVSIGVERPAATVHDLADALAATLRGAPATPAAGPAVGCYIADFIS
jgi:hypothetical protein